MKSHVYKLIELTGTSPTSIEDAVARAIQRAHKNHQEPVLVPGGRNARQYQ
jgi:flavin-binding protein dodecin